MEISTNKTIVPEFQRMGVFNVLETANRSCEQHGAYVASRYKFGWTGCSQCMEEKRLAEGAERRQRDEADRVQARIKRLFDRAAIPPRFKDRTLDTYKAELDGQKKALATARKYVSTFDGADGTSMIFCGGVGAGKTHLAIGIAKELMLRNRSALFISVMGAVRSVKDTWRNSEITEKQALNSLIEPDLLILDEVGVQFGSDAEKLILFEIINGRYENCRATILISNLAIQTLTEYLGERVVDRLREGGGKMVPFDWGSYRSVAA